MGHKIEFEVVTLRYLCYISSKKDCFFLNKIMLTEIYEAKNLIINIQKETN